MSQLRLGFEQHTSINQFTKPAGYKGLYGFHKYWGKKPAETVSFLVEQLSERGDVVLDPFLGSGAVAREAFMRGRRVIAGDLNPVAVELATLVANPPPAIEIQQALQSIEAEVRSHIESAYPLPDGNVATHYLWQGDELRQVWAKGSNGTRRVEYEPTAADVNAIEKFRHYQPQTLRPLHMFKNSRINSFEDMQWRDLFTGRALRNLELLRCAILQLPNSRARHALLIVLTAASGQMSNMVFAIEKRGKTTGVSENGRIEVGSWVIGFWRPALHFEVNVWNCFENKAQALLRGLQQGSYDRSPRMSEKPLDVIERRAEISLVNLSAGDLLAGLPSGSVQLLVTDPPHGDRIPYLELSEIWNAILGRTSHFEKELIVSNATARRQTFEHYAEQMKQVFQLAGQALAPTGRLAIMFNSRSVLEWEALLAATQAGQFDFCGCFPMAYSAGSVVQDSRSGALKQDYVLVFAPARNVNLRAEIRRQLGNLPGWSDYIPKGAA